MAIGGNHGDGFRLQHHQRAIQRVAGFFIRDRKTGPRDHAAQNLRWNLHNSGSRKHWQAGKIRPRHADHLGVRPSTADAHPMVLKHLDRDVRVRQQLHIIMQLARRDRARAFLFNFGIAGCPQAEIQIGCRERQPVAASFKQIVRQNGDRRLALNYSLGRRKFSE